MVVTGPATPIAFLDTTYSEAVTLAREARDYLGYQQAAEAERLDPTSRLVVSCEAMRLTARLSQVIAWLLVQKAVHAGEIDRQDARAPDYRLGGQAVCGESEPVVDAPLPEHLVTLLDRSHRLYERVERLDRMLDATANAP